MSLPTTPDTRLPGLDALHATCQIFGADPTDAHLLHHRSNAVYLLPHEQIVARLAPDTPVRRRRAQTTITATRWLATQPAPVALPPMPGQQPVIANGAVATFWPHRATTSLPSLTDLAVLMRRLHALPAPPFPVPHYQPLQRLSESLEIDQHRQQPALAAADHTWLLDRATTLLDTFTATQFPLGEGLVHGDAHNENMVHDHGEWLLIDWDNTCIGPRELDLLTAVPNHFHKPEADRTQFLTAYGYNILDQPGWPVLRDITELHSLGSYIRLAPSKPAAATELHHRIRSLRTGDRSARWHAIP
ncbi:phosphotransferase family protein [Saccharopolyspora phatthalungensis]|uniref:Ser/Thr protein kinase RdoA (MazF antagonist) n=1 Tax=Saccharopolyspora phatthalungensis TaxID=664693 RepID=A0A840QIF2_9PSEU|nr:aminoglycoside phosphotransferase family protein [Saccharopolyspora phatthalungensis]MBB5160037.1 Ser/Thr protein kinase RdoA (MazF antagonist) [Saccharopolyspora phatthalungensis]